jgi:DNA-binding transcriptional MerR regulator
VQKSYQVQEFAELAGVTVRALHHYDRLGLLRPHRTASGYRLYTLRDLERLEQIVALKFLGIPLRQIGALLDREALGLAEALRRQRAALEAKRRLLDRAIRALRDAENSAHGRQRPPAGLLKKIIEVIEMQQDADWMKKYYSDEAWDKIERRGRRWTPELQERVSREWSDLFRDVEAALETDPAGPRAQALAARWMGLVEEFTQADKGVTAGVADLYKDRANWPAGFQQQMKPYSNPKVWEFMRRALACRPTSPENPPSRA